MSSRSNLTTLRSVSAFLIVLILFTSCSVQVPRSDVYYVDTQTQQKRIWQTITDENDRYKLSLTPLGNLDESLLFEVYVLNKGITELTINPTLWSMQPTISYDEELQSLDRIDLMSTDEIASVYNQLADKMQTAKEQNDAIAIVVGAILVIGLIAIIAETQNAASNNRRRDVVTNNYRSSVIINPMINLGFHANPYRSYTRMNTKERIKFLRDEAERYSKSFIEATSLGPGEEVYFNIFFPRVASVRNFTLNWELDGQFLEWQFYHVINGMKTQQDVGVPSGVE